MNRTHVKDIKRSGTGTVAGEQYQFKGEFGSLSAVQVLPAGQPTHERSGSVLKRGLHPQHV